MEIFERTNKGYLYFYKAKEYTEKNSLKKIFLKKYYAKKAIEWYNLAMEEFQYIREHKMLLSSMIDSLKHYYILDKFEKMETINVLISYFIICNNANISINEHRELIDFFENNCIPILNKQKHIVKIGYIYRLIADNLDKFNFIEAIEFYEKSNYFYNMTKLKYEIQINNYRIKKIENTIKK